MLNYPAEDKAPIHFSFYKVDNKLKDSDVSVQLLQKNS